MPLQEISLHKMAKFRLSSKEEVVQAQQAAIQHPEMFWSTYAKGSFEWFSPWDKVLDYDFHKAKVSWFEGGKVNITVNCLDRYAQAKPNARAIVWEPNNPDDEGIVYTYAELLSAVNKMANTLKQQGVSKGDRVCLYLPMIPELAIAVLACARIGAIHSVVFAGFSAQALAARINDASCSLVVCSDGANRGSKVLDLKSIVDEALQSCDCVHRVLVVNHVGLNSNWVEGRDIDLKPLLSKASDVCEAEVMDAEDPLFILYTSGSTGKPKGMLHTTGGYMTYTAYTFQNVFQYHEGDVYWCTADIGWITGHSYIVYGPLLNGATTLMFEGVPSYPDYGRFWAMIEKYQVNQFYTAPTAIRALAKASDSLVDDYDLSSLKVLGTVGEPINEEAWQWYNKRIGKDMCPIVDTWWQTETGGIMISSIPGSTPSIPTFATQPMPGIQAQLMDDDGQPIQDKEASGKLCIGFPWPSMARTIYGDHQRYIDTYFSAYPGYYFTGDGADRDAEGNYRITGRVDDVIIVSGHNLGTAPIEDAINEHDLVAESAIVGIPHDIKGNALCAFVVCSGDEKVVTLSEVNALISAKVGPIAKLDVLYVVKGLPKTRSGKIMRRILRKVAQGQFTKLGDISTLLNPDVVDSIIQTVRD